MFSAYYKGMLQEGVYLAPSQFEAFFVSAAHTMDHIDATVRAAENVLEGLKK
jgi:glutamate-1-semialdehyde 2,1-aminomutase